MRKIKFRAWNTETKTMVDLYKITPLALSETLMQDGLFLPFHKDLILMQYTGVKDKNGKEIYEGDIVKGYFDEAEVTDHIWLGLSEQEKKQGYRIFVFKNMFSHYEIPMPDDLEIIGNVYENKDLLNSP